MIYKVVLWEVHVGSNIRSNYLSQLTKTCFSVASDLQYLRMYKISPSGWILMSKLGIVTNWKSPSLALGKKTSGFQMA